MSGNFTSQELNEIQSFHDKLGHLRGHLESLTLIPTNPDDPLLVSRQLIEKTLQAIYAVEPFITEALEHPRCSKIIKSSE